MLKFEVTYYYTSRRTCIYSYTTMDDFLVSVDIDQQFTECYKDVITLLWTVDNWTGKYAKWIDDCQLSTPETIEYTYDSPSSRF